MYSGFMMSLRGWGSRCPHFTWIFSAADKLQTTSGLFMFHFIRQRETHSTEYGPSLRVNAHLALLDIGGCSRPPSTDGQTEAQHGSLSMLPRFGECSEREGTQPCCRERGPCGWVGSREHRKQSPAPNSSSSASSCRLSSSTGGPCSSQ